MPEVRSTVIVMRHCVRSTDDGTLFGRPNLTHFDNYSHTSWPEFPVPAMYCLPRGADIIVGEGKWLKAHGQLHEPIRVIADACERDNVTAKSLMRGLGLNSTAQSFLISGDPFNHKDDSTCHMEKNARAAAVRRRVASASRDEAMYAELMQQVYNITGNGAAGNWTNISCAVDNTTGFQEGNCMLASEFTERLLMEWGGDMSIGWGHSLASPENIPRLLQLHAWYREVNDAVLVIDRTHSASIARAVLESLDKGGTTIFVGHDSQLDGLKSIMGLGWDASPFPANVTLPGSMLRFQRDGAKVTASYIFVPNFTDDSGDMEIAPAQWALRSGDADASAGEACMADMRQMTTAKFEASCANPLPKWEEHLQPDGETPVADAALVV